MAFTASWARESGTSRYGGPAKSRPVFGINSFNDFSERLGHRMSDGMSDDSSVCEYHPAGTAATPGHTLSVKAGDDVELKNGDFLRIMDIRDYCGSGEMQVRGIYFRRTWKVKNRLPKATNELCALLSGVRPDEDDPPVDSYQIDLPLDALLCHRKIILTNKIFGGSYKSRNFSDLSFRDGLIPGESASEGGTLVCRWKSIAYGDLAGGKGYSGALLRIREHEADPGRGIPDAALVYWWRDGDHSKSPFAFVPGVAINLTADDPRASRKEKAEKRKGEGSAGFEDSVTLNRTKRVATEYETGGGEVEFQCAVNVRTEGTDTCAAFTLGHMAGTQKRNQGSTEQVLTPRPSVEELCSEERTYFDICAGAGGMATGVKQAGFTVKYLLDKEAPECRTLQLAFPGAKVFEMGIHQFFRHTKGRKKYKVATAHISFPCKTYSGAHTRDGKKDSENEDTSCSIDEILATCLPKVVSFEQTSHMVKLRKNRPFFNRLLYDITWNNYSVRWKVVDCTEHGSPSKRERLIMFASCAGHAAPSFPPPRPLPKTTIADVLASKPRAGDIDQHMLQYSVKDGAAYDPNQVLSCTITCNGGGADMHPSGMRSFDCQELAMLASLPAWRKFAPAPMTKLREMIGNMVPSTLGYDMYKMVHKCLDEGEVEMAMWLMGEATGKANVKPEQGKKTGPVEEQPEVIALDEDTDDEVIMIG